MATPTDRATDDAPMQLAECGSCRQLFVLPLDAGDVVACPVCGVARSTTMLSVREVGVATTVVVEPLAEPEAPAADLVEGVIDEAASNDAQPNETPDGPTVELATADAEETSLAAAVDLPIKPANDPAPLPTVADWLRRAETESVAESEELMAPHSLESPPIEEPEAKPLAGKPSLSTALGWDPGSFRVDESTKPAVAAPATREEPTQPPVAPAPAVTPEQPPAEREFGFDFGRTPLTASVEPSVVEPSDSPAPIAIDNTDDRWQDELLLTDSDESPQRRTWLGFAGRVAAGIVLVAAPAAYLWTDSAGWLNGESPLAMADESRGVRARMLSPGTVAESLPAERPIIAAAVEATSADGVEMPDAATRRYDAATEPASFQQPADAAPAELPIKAEADSSADVSSLPVETPLTPPAGDRYAVNAGPPADAWPAELSGKPAEPQPPVPTDPFASASGGSAALPLPVHGVQPTTEAELAEAIRQADGAAQAFARGDLSDPSQVPAMGQHYARLSRLAQALTCYQSTAASPGAELQAIDLLRRAWTTDAGRAQSASIAGPWIEWADRPHDGVFFAGVPSDARSAGEFTSYAFELGDRTISVVTDEPIDARRYIRANSEQIGVLGLLVERPSESLPGYEGDEASVIWARKTVPLGPPMP